MLRFLIFFIILGISSTSYSFTNKVTSVSISGGGSVGQTLTIQWGTGADNSAVPLPAAGNRYELLAYAKHMSGRTQWAPLAQTGPVPGGLALGGNSIVGKTWSELAQMWVQRFGPTGPYRVGPLPFLETIEVCFATGPWSSPQILRSSCLKPGAPPVVECRVGGTLTIDHGVLAAAKVNNAYASQPLYLTCSGETNLRVHVSPYWVYMGGGLLSMISVNGISSDQTLKVGGSTTLTIGSRLSGTAVSPGVHTGFTVISLDII